MSIRVDTSSLISGAIVCGNRGLGVFAETIPSTGDNGASFLFNDVSLPADNGKEICGRITVWPSAGSLYVYENGSFDFSGAPDGAYTFDDQFYVNGVAVGSPTTNTLYVGPITATFSVITDDALFSGNARPVPRASFTAVTADSTFSGGAVNAGLPATVLFNATTGDVYFTGGASSAAVPFTPEQLAFLLAYMQENLMIPTAEENATAAAIAVLAAMNASPPPVDATKINGQPIYGDGRTTEFYT